MLATFKFCLPVRSANLESLVGVVTKLLNGWFRFRCPPGARDYFCTKMSRPAHPASYWMGNGDIALRREFDLSPPTSRSQEWVEMCLYSLLCLHCVHKAPLPFSTLKLTISKGGLPVGSESPDEQWRQSDRGNIGLFLFYGLRVSGVTVELS
jgi:hypothetical protein